MYSVCMREGWGEGERESENEGGRDRKKEGGVWKEGGM